MVFVNLAHFKCADIIDKLFQKIHLDNPVVDGDEERKWRGYVCCSLLTCTVEILMRQLYFLLIKYLPFLFTLHHKLQKANFQPKPSITFGNIRSQNSYGKIVFFTHKLPYFSILYHKLPSFYLAANYQ